MPAKPVSIEFVAEIAQYLRATKKVEVSTDDIADALVAVSKDADDLERDLNRAMKKAAKEPERLERVVKDLGRSIEDTGDSAKKAGRRIEREFDDAGQKLDDVGRDAGQEYMQGLGEAISSGDTEGLVEGVAGGLVSGLTGGLGAAAAVVGTAVVAMYARFKQESEEYKAAVEEQVNNLYEGLLQGKSDFLGAWDQESLNERVQETIGAMSGQEIQDAKKFAAELGVEWSTMAAALAGQPEAVQAVADAADRTEQAAYDANKEFLTWESTITDAQVPLEHGIAEAIDYARELTDKNIDAMEEYGVKANAVVQALEGLNGKNYRATFQLVPADAFTEDTLNRTGP